MIRNFDNNHAFLSNFYPSPINHEGVVYPTVEHFYQAMKSASVVVRKTVANLPTPAATKKYGRKIALRADWEEKKVEIMTAALRAKFKYPELKAKLLATDVSLLEEGNYWHDNFWGNCSCPKCWNTVGYNVLGKLLMMIRAEIQHDEARK
jgi:hypothetical protein